MIFPRVWKLILGKIDKLHQSCRQLTGHCFLKRVFDSGQAGCEQPKTMKPSCWKNSLTFALPSALTVYSISYTFMNVPVSFQIPTLPGKNKYQHPDNKSCFESAPSKSCLFNVHTETVFLVISFNFTEQEGLDFQHMFVPRKPTCKGGTWPPSQLQPECSPVTVQMRPDGTHSYT